MNSEDKLFTICEFASPEDKPITLMSAEVEPSAPPNKKLPSTFELALARLAPAPTLPFKSIVNGAKGSAALVNSSPSVTPFKVAFAFVPLRTIDTELKIT